MHSDEIKTEIVSCALCGGGDSEILFVGRDMLHGTPGEWPVVRCLKCGLVYTNPQPTLESIGSVYPKDYSRYRAKAPKKLSRRFHLQQWALREHWNYPPHKSSLPGKLISWPFFLWAKYKRRNFDLFAWEGRGKLLDYGCGGGGYLLRMRSRGWDVTGMDMSDQAVDSCRDQGFDARAGVDPTEEFAPETFDVVTLWHVLEHVPDPLKTLAQINTVLREGGRFMLGLPNIKSPLARWFGKYWFAWELPRHLRHFEPSTIIKMLEKNGFQVKRIFNQKYGQTVQTSFRYLNEQKPNWVYRLFSKSKRLSYIIDLLSHYSGQGGIMIIYARKTSAAKEALL